MSVLRPKPGNPLTKILRLNQETCAPHLLMHGADRTQRHPTYRSSGHQVSNMYLSLVLYTMSPTPAMIIVAAHHVAPITYTPWDKQMRLSTWIYRGKTTEITWISIQTTASQWLIIIKPRYWPLYFSISLLMSTLITKSTKFEFRVQDAWSIARRPKSPRKAKEGHLEEGEATKSTSGTKGGKTKERAKKSSKSNSSWNKLSLTKLNASSPLLDKHYHVSSLNHPVSKSSLSPLDRHYYVSSLNHSISKSSTNFMHNLSPFGNNLIKHKLREEWDDMHEIKIWFFTRYRVKYLSIYTQPLCQDLQRQEWIITNRLLQDNKQVDMR
jgi:hypothetical protein